ncbi:MAG: Gfo/Idh/MocA family oxidoreductase [Nitrosopumilus sp.]|uniref:Gfo/Idh/MocA family protein n=1 Tax=Nitrosopumilus sp. TaxID=2024843 RepID=UPI00247E25CA|nr:Gfo/Idh/MocA family oxidoreductase [Nitrosopumilus sp.]MCV0393565.1 Gfo/Idh/MocA family oxidoreductase [Nitrosopumilus sp.]
MKILIVGLGSMGKRRIRNMQYLRQEEIIGFDPREDRCKEVLEKYGVRSFQDINQALKEKPNAMIISTPPDLHMAYAKIAIKNNIHFFTEASVVQDDMLEVIKMLEKNDIVGLPSCTMRYHPIVKMIKTILEKNIIGKPLSFLYHSGQYLPDWHPWEDYRKFYVAKKETGACREIVPFELIWLTDLFGKIKTVSGHKSKVSHLEVDIDDIYNILLEFENGMESTLTVDVIARFPFRQLKILGEKGVILADWSEKNVKYYTNENGWTENKVDDGIVEENYIHGEGPYIEEMSSFLDSIQKKIEQPYTFKEDLQILKILEIIESSSESGLKKNVGN